ncbi:hypothetical protein PENNAL_c0018G05355 [Penicillium nalgiovense]|uniref:Thiamine-binding protein domain-containing protein n=1 Tax=Penicillium nalgiovense TaxID=60175 RepID=A0A1V6YKF0_PENNA|nr:hypothetical protein PENNAL_c0018G05355 [Penicillium nalgiovense]
MSNIATPDHCVADFCLVPVGTSSPSVSDQVADIHRMIETCGLKYVMHSAGTTLVLPWPPPQFQFQFQFQLQLLFM